MLVCVCSKVLRYDRQVNAKTPQIKQLNKIFSHQLSVFRGSDAHVEDENKSIEKSVKNLVQNISCSAGNFHKIVYNGNFKRALL